MNKYQLNSCFKGVQLSKNDLSKSFIDLSSPIQCWSFEKNYFQIYENDSNYLYTINISDYSAVKTEHIIVGKNQIYDRASVNPKRIIKNDEFGFKLDVVVDEMESDSISIMIDNNTTVYDNRRVDNSIYGKLKMKGFFIINNITDSYDMKFEFDESKHCDFYLFKDNGYLKIYLLSKKI